MTSLSRGEVPPEGDTWKVPPEGDTRKADKAWDLVVVGGGPAGMSAALVASLNRVETLLLERSARLGGQVRWADAPIPDLLGGSAADGDELADRFAAHLASSRARVRTGVSVDALRQTAGRIRLSLAGGEELDARRVLLATGLGHRTLGVPGEELADSIASPRKTIDSFHGRRIAVVGGGDEASSLAHDLAHHGARVTLLSRGKLRARPAFGDAVRAEPGVDVREGAVVAAFEGGAELVAVVLISGEHLAAEFCFIRIGVEPQPPATEPPLEQHPDGRLRVDEELRTSWQRLFAAGDLVRPRGEHYIAAALADGAVVARRVEADMVNEAGELSRA